MHLRDDSICVKSSETVLTLLVGPQFTHGWEWCCCCYHYHHLLTAAARACAGACSEMISAHARALEGGFTHLIIEKPFGKDTASFNELNACTSSLCGSPTAPFLICLADMLIMLVRVRSDIIRNARIENVGKSHPFMVRSTKLRFLLYANCERIVFLSVCAAGLRSHSCIVSIITSARRSCST